MSDTAVHGKRSLTLELLPALMMLTAIVGVAMLVAEFQVPLPKAKPVAKIAEVSSPVSDEERKVLDEFQASVDRADALMREIDGELARYDYNLDRYPLALKKKIHALDALTAEREVLLERWEKAQKVRVRLEAASGKIDW